MNKYYSLLNSSAVAIGCIDLVGNCTYVNNACLQILGYSNAKQLLGKNLHNLIHYAHADGSIYDLKDCPVNKASKDGSKSHNVGDVFWRADGTCFPVEYWSNPIFINRKIHGSVVSFTDISVRKHIEAKLKRSEASLKELNAGKDRLLSILAHDLKTPFNSILGFLDLLTENIRNYDIDTIEEQIMIVNNSAIDFYNLLEELLLWAMARSNKLPFNPHKFNFSTVCSEVVENLKMNANAKSITINSFAIKDLHITADIEMIKTVLRNLLSNAIKFSNNGGQINIFSEQNQTTATITVSDNGIGIEPDLLPKLFDVSQIITTQGTANEKGTGLGLLLCKAFVEKHGGQIWVESKSGLGSDFKFTIPIYSGKE